MLVFFSIFSPGQITSFFFAQWWPDNFSLVEMHMSMIFCADSPDVGIKPVQPPLSRSCSMCTVRHKMKNGCVSYSHDTVLIFSWLLLDCIFCNCCWNVFSPQTEISTSIALLLQWLFNCLGAMLWMEHDHMTVWRERPDFVNKKKNN